MITILSFLFILVLLSTDWLSGLLVPNNLAEIGVVILGMIALSASVQIRALFEKAQRILRLYAQYTDPKSEKGSKLSPKEKGRLLDLFLHELRITIDQFGGKILIRVGGLIRKVFNKLFG
ncbi:hypothetical protein CK503_08555 [Aliifodinibius salipaludis]|jgi:hypothetical protein|uniref:Uncharacterized protein n=1 Tax=Fodinibius salipaludis TaxID=2032627 RepID=A0A2A2GB87_9BACT|nr:hypothetical protein [Aliifodinibius salipaludis]PAU94254.1 hypothetical protein CK503_08555 [Aliifodinibius salipaludis]